MRLARSQSGQAQILTAILISVVMITGAAYSLEFARLNTQGKIKLARRSEMRSALQAAILHASQIYRNEANCDPRGLDQKLSTLNPGFVGVAPVARPTLGRRDGSVLNPVQVAATAQGFRQLDIQVKGTWYTVSFGPVTRLPWIAAVDPTIGPPSGYNAGTSQDAMIEVSTRFGNMRQTTGPGGLLVPSTNQKLTQRAVLINNCSVPCVTSAEHPQDICPANLNQAVDYHSISSVALHPGVANPDAAFFNLNTPGPGCLSMRGDVYGPAGAQDGRINVIDLLVLKNYLRTQLSPAPTAAVLACMDLNNDSRVNDHDLGILEKYLRGYLWWIPTGR